MDEHDDQDCNTTLELGLNQYKPRRENSRIFFLDFSISCPSDLKTIELSSSIKGFGKNENEQNKEGGDDSGCSKSCGRKKLRLTEDQTTLLEDTFKQNSTLNTTQKQALAEKLSLKPRQVEVWFQNRRARTKLKQMEIECKFLKKSCERLSEENQRLKKELLELRSAVKMQKPPPEAAAPLPQLCFFHITKAAKLETCPSRENKIDKSRGGGDHQEEAAEAVTEVVHQPKGDQLISKE